MLPTMLPMRACYVSATPLVDGTVQLQNADPQSQMRVFSILGGGCHPRRIADPPRGATTCYYAATTSSECLQPSRVRMNAQSYMRQPGVHHSSARSASDDSRQSVAPCAHSPRSPRAPTR